MSTAGVKRLGIAVLCAVSTVAAAHETSTAFLHIERLTSTDVELTLELAMEDVAHLAPLDADGDGAVTAGEVRAGRDGVAEVLRGGLSLSSAASPCAVEPTASELVRRGEAVYLRQRFASRCAHAERRLRYALLFDGDPQHRVLVRFEGAEEGIPLMLTAREREVSLAEGASGGFVAMVAEGVWHIWIGIDHILFLIALLLPSVLERRSGRWVPAESFWPAASEVLKVVSAFTVAHSITLVAAQRGWIAFDVRWVEVAIAVSVIAAAVNNLLSLVKARWTLAFALGLLHGLGFSSVLTELGTANVWSALLAFNVGVELGQLAVVALFLPIAYLARSSWAYRWVGVMGGSAAIAVVALLWSFERMVAA